MESGGRSESCGPCPFAPSIIPSFGLSSGMQKLLLATFLFAGLGFAQTPDCVVPFTFTAALQATATTGCGNNTQGITDWRMAYLNVGGGFAALNIVVQSSPDNASWVTFVGTAVEGVNPNTASPQASVHLDGFNAYVRVQLASVTGAGSIRGVLYGCRNPGCSTLVTASAIISGLIDVQGPVAAGAAQTGNPLPGGGVDSGGLAQYLPLNATGQPAANALIADADALSNTALAETNLAGSTMIANRIRGYLFNGTTWDRQRGNVSGTFVAGVTAAGGVIPATQGPVVIGIASAGGLARQAFGMNAVDDGDNGANMLSTGLSLFNGATYNREFQCTLSAAITLAAGTDVVIVTNGGGSTVTKICGFSFSSDTSADVTIRQGTGATCATNQVALSGAYENVLGLALDFGNNGALRTTVAARDVCLHFSAASTVGGIVTYAQF